MLAPPARSAASTLQAVIHFLRRFKGESGKHAACKGDLKYTSSPSFARKVSIKGNWCIFIVLLCVLLIVFYRWNVDVEKHIGGVGAHFFVNFTQIVATNASYKVEKK